MCNDYRLEVEASATLEDFSDLKIKISFSEGTPNIQARQDIKITDTAPIVRTIDSDPNAGDLVQRRWSWPGPNGKPVYNFRSDGREFASGRCLIIADGFYEFTNPADKKKNAKTSGSSRKRTSRSSASRESGGPIRMSARHLRC
jgi:putative SOS response-associated peptidase YedK